MLCFFFLEVLCFFFLKGHTSFVIFNIIVIVDSVIALFSKNPLFVRNGFMKIQKCLFVAIPFFYRCLRKMLCFFFLEILCFFFLKRHTSFVVFYKMLCSLWFDFCSFCFLIYSCRKWRFGIL